MSEVELVLDAHALNGETPTWSVAEQKLYWIDIEAPALHRFDPATGRDEQWRMPSEIGAFALCEDGRVLAALAHRAAAHRPRAANIRAARDAAL